MNQEQRDWLEWLKRARDGVITQRKAAELMGVTDRWVRKLLVEMEGKGDGVVVHGLEGRPSNRRIDGAVQARALEALGQPDWHDFGPTFGSEQLAKRCGIQVSKETLRKWMMAAGMWKPGERRVEGAHVWRPRRSGYGELVQWDTSDHDWLEGRGERVRHLVGMIDDATSQAWGRFVWHDGTRENMGVLRSYLERHGRMLEVYTDRDSMFSVPVRAGEGERQRLEADRLTQIGRALRELGIVWIAAGSPQAKGRIERSFKTDQDRLVKLLRLEKVTTLQKANEFLEKEYWPDWNARFARPAAGYPNLHRPVGEGLDLEGILSHVETRVIRNDYTFPWGARLYRIARGDIKPGMRRESLRVELHLDGTLRARHQGRSVEISECSAKPGEPPPAKPGGGRKDHNRDGKSRWMDGFFERPAPPLWQALQDSKA